MASDTFSLPPPFLPLPPLQPGAETIGFWLPAQLDWLMALMVACIDSVVPLGLPAARNKLAMQAAASALLSGSGAGRRKADVVRCVAGIERGAAACASARDYVMAPETWARAGSTVNVLADAFVHHFVATHGFLPDALVGVFCPTHYARDLYIGVYDDDARPGAGRDDARAPAACVAILKLLTMHVYSRVLNARVDAADGCDSRIMAKAHACVVKQVEASLGRLFGTATAFRNIARGVESSETYNVHVDEVSAASKHVFTLLRREVMATADDACLADENHDPIVQVGCRLIDVLLQKHAAICGVASE